MMRLPDDLGRPPLLRCDAGTEAVPMPALMSTTLNHATAAYVMAARPAFDGLRQAAGQLAGVLVLAAACGRSAPGHPMLAVAREVWAEAMDVIRRLEAPEPGRHHHRHLRSAAVAIGRALAEARCLSGNNATVVDVILRPLRDGFQELQWAAGALPGFEIVAFEQGCCARHRGVRRVADDRMQHAVEVIGDGIQKGNG